MSIITKISKYSLLLPVLLGINLFHGFISFAQEPDYIFTHHTFEEGLPYIKKCNSIEQDQDGFIWLGTDAGLHRFDGNNFKNYLCQNNAAGAIRGSYINDLLITENGNIFIANSIGIDLLSPRYESIEPLLILSAEDSLVNFSVPIIGFLKDDNENIYAHSHSNLFRYNASRNCFYIVNQLKLDTFNLGINKIISNGDTAFWIGTNTKGLYYYNIRNNTIRSYSTANGLKSNDIKDIVKINDSLIYIGTVKGINKISLGQNGTFSIESLDNEILKDIIINSFHLFNDSLLFIATDGEGLIKYNIELNLLSNYKSNPNSRFSLMDNKINLVFVDNYGGLWTFMVGYGFSSASLNKEHFFMPYFGLPGIENALSYNLVSCFQDYNESVLIGTDGGGLNLFFPEKGIFKHLDDKKNGQTLLSSKAVTCIYKSVNDEYWIGTYEGGINIIKIKDNSISSVKILDKASHNLSGNDIAAITKGVDDNMYILTYSNGLNIYNPEKKTVKQILGISVGPYTLSHNGGNSLLSDSKGNIWIATYYGLNRFNLSTGIIDKFLTETYDSTSISDYRVNCMVEDEYGNLWLGTDNGLNYYNYHTGTFKRHYVSDGLPNNSINSLLIDSDENLWIGTNNGLSRYNYKLKRFENFFKTNGLAGNCFMKNACYEDKNGVIYFGTTNGFTIFHSERKTTNNNCANIFLTDLLIFDKPVKVREKVNSRIILKEDISKLDKIVLTHLENNFSFTFSVIDFIDPGKYRYLFKMVGFDSDWRIVNRKTGIASYTNLNPGEYTFLVRAEDIISGILTPEKSLKITILTPWWKTWWAVAFYSFIILGLFVIYLRILESRINLKKDLYLEKLEHEKQVESNRMKVNFFTNITHEFRTPLTLILGPIEDLLTNYKNDTFLINNLSSIKKSANRLLNLINELLDIRKLEDGSLDLRVSSTNITRFVQEIAGTFIVHAEIHNINFNITQDIKDVYVWIDKNKFEKVIFNLLSNAFKFTQDGGNINCILKLAEESISDEFKEGYFEIEIIDDGIGIQTDDVKNIFKRYYTSDSNISKSTGIGLSLSKEIIELHHGEIIAKNNINKGATFTVKIPLGKEHIANYIVNSQFNNKYFESINENISIIDKINFTSKTKKTLDKDVLLIIEDDLEVKSFIKQIFIQYYDVIEAENGDLGYKLAKERLPNIIISDILMPGLSGTELCRGIKNDELTSHIPIILLTALSDIDNQIMGVESGADAYITKPFHPSHLISQVKKLLELRITLQKKYSQTLNSANFTKDFKPKEIEKLSLDEVFLKKVLELIEEKISDSDFKIEDLCKNLGMNYLQLYRKIKALTNLSIKNFIMTVRLKSAANLILKDKFTMSEICFEVGFTSPAYFAKCFRSFYGMTPTDYLLRNKQN